MNSAATRCRFLINAAHLSAVLSFGSLTPVAASAQAKATTTPAAAVMRIRLQSVAGLDSLTTPLLGGPGAKLVGVLARDAALTQVVRKDTVAAGGSWALGKLDVGTYFLEFQVTEADGRGTRSAVYKLLLNENWRQTVYDIVSPAEPQ